MTITFLLSKRGDLTFKKKITVEKFPCFIGRSEDSDIYLEDDLKIISRRHSKISENEDSFFISNFQTKNSTFINNTSLEPNQHMVLNNGDIVSIGQYAIKIIIRKQKENGKKIFADKNVFESELDNIYYSLQQLDKKFLSENESCRNESLKAGVTKLHARMKELGIYDRVHDWINESLTQKINITNSNDSIKIIKDDYLDENFDSNKIYFLRIMDILLANIIQLSDAFFQFKNEFLGVTIVQSMPVNSLEDLKKFLFEDTVSKEDKKQKLEELKKLLLDLSIHQISLLQAHNQAVLNGLNELISDLQDPDKASEVKDSSSFILLKKKKGQKEEYGIKILNKLKKMKEDIELVKKDYFKSNFTTSYRNIYSKIKRQN